MDTETVETLVVDMYDGTWVPCDGDDWSVDEMGYLHVWNGDDIVATFACGSWECIGNEELEVDDEYFYRNF